MVLDQLDLLARPLSEVSWSSERSEWPYDADVIEVDGEDLGGWGREEPPRKG
jgi:hypothetical protein